MLDSGRRMGHADAIVDGEGDTAEAKKRILAALVLSPKIALDLI